MADKLDFGAAPVKSELRDSHASREWRRPELRKLPIATTAGSGKATIAGNDGVGGGKGDVSLLVS
jgi:hypothetical protein